MGFLTDHKKTIMAGFILLAIILGAAVGTGGNMPGLYDFSRYFHVLAGIVWIGLLYYFNFVQVPSLGGVTPETKADIFKDGSIVRRALFWFRMGAHATLLFGLILYYGLIKNELDHAGGIDIMIGATFAIIMWFNVTFIIWPNQKKVIGVVEADADTKAAAGKKALMASRINTLLSIPMLFLMFASTHFPIFAPLAE
ncbi:MAG: urate hydroxylase PuuD [Ghiorsea sp.]|nr:urate hydroxylase PuuD [Ghiorsea sp.]